MSAEHYALPICAHRFLFIWLQYCWSLLCWKWTGKKRPEDHTFTQKQIQTKRAKAGQTLAELLHNLPPTRTPLGNIAGPYQHGSGPSGRAFAWHSSQTSSAAWLLKVGKETLSFSLVDLRWGSYYRWGSSPVSFTVSWLNEGSAQMQPCPSHPSEFVGVSHGFHRDHLPLGFAAWWMIAFCCSWCSDSLWWSQDQRQV